MGINWKKVKCIIICMVILTLFFILASVTNPFSVDIVGLNESSYSFISRNQELVYNVSNGNKLSADMKSTLKSQVLSGSDTISIANAISDLAKDIELKKSMDRTNKLIIPINASSTNGDKFNAAHSWVKTSKAFIPLNTRSEKNYVIALDPIIFHLVISNMKIEVWYYYLD